MYIIVTYFFISFISSESVSSSAIQKKGMLKSLFPIELLLSQLREMNVPNISEVDTAILETSGRVSVLKKSDYIPVTPSDLNIPVLNSGLPIILVNDGRIIDKNLISIGFNTNWLKEELLKFGVTDMKNVYLATIDGAGKIYYSLSE